MIFKIFLLLQVFSFYLEGKSVAAYECVEYIPGNMNLVLTAPHGGYHVISTCPTRKDGCLDSQGKCYYDSSADCDRTEDCPGTTVQDAYTEEMSPMIADFVEEVSGSKRPHVVIMKCARKSVDVNRDKEEGAQRCPDAEAAWHTYHNTIEGILDAFEGERGLLLDFHGQSHKQNRTEFGYAVDKRDIDSAVASPDHEFPAGSLADCSITALMHRLTSGGEFNNWDVLVGSQSLAHVLEKEGFGGLPSETFPGPGQTKYEYFNGGYTVRTYGSKAPEDTVDAIQMETPSEVRIDGGLSMRKRFARGLAQAMVNFFNMHYN